MPRGTPNIGNRDRREELSQPSVGPEVLGTIAPSSLEDQARAERTVSWTNEDGVTIQMTEPPPPWEQSDSSGLGLSDARRFVECPPQWHLYWVNPRLLDSEGWRDWQAVQASDPRVKVRVSTMVTPEGYIRRGGSGGDILAWMWEGWHASLRKRTAAKTALQTRSAADKQRQLKEEFKRGTYGPFLHLDDVKHPTHTIADGRTMRDQ